MLPGSSALADGQETLSVAADIGSTIPLAVGEAAKPASVQFGTAFSALTNAGDRVCFDAIFAKTNRLDAGETFSVNLTGGGFGNSVGVGGGSQDEAFVCIQRPGHPQAQDFEDGTESFTLSTTGGNGVDLLWLQVSVTGTPAGTVGFRLAPSEPPGFQYTVSPGGTLSVGATLTDAGYPADPAPGPTLSAQTNVPGATATVSPSGDRPPASASASVVIPSGTPLGLYFLLVKGTGPNAAPNYSRSFQVPFQVVAAAPPPAPVADLGVALSGDASPVAGTTMTYTATVTNGGPAVNDSFSLSVPLDSDVTFVDATTPDCGHVGNTVTCTGTGLPAGGQVAYTIHASLDKALPAGTAISTTATVTPTGTTVDPTGDTNDTSTASTTSAAKADLAPTISAPHDDLIAGNAFDATVTVANGGPSNNAGGYDVTSTPLPNGVSFVSGAGCTGDATSFTCSAASLAAGATADSYTVHLQIASSRAAGTGVPISVSVTPKSGATADPNPDNNSATDSITIIARADLGLTDSVSDPTAGSWGVTDALVAGDDVTYTLTVKNFGPSDSAGGYNVTDVLPHGATFVSSPDGCSKVADAAGTDGDTVQCSGGDLVFGAEKTFSVTAHIDPAESPTATYADRASISPNALTTEQPTPDTHSDTASASAALVARADLGITDTAEAPSPLYGNPPGTVVAGDDRGYTYTLTVKNYGPSANTGVTVTDVLPHGAVYVSAGEGDPCLTSAVAGGGHGETVTCTVASLGFNQEQTFTVRAKVLASESRKPYADATTYDDAASVAPSPGETPQPTPNTNSDAAVARVTMVARADFTAVSLVHETPFANPDTVYATRTDDGRNVVAYIYKYTNNGPSDGRDVTLSLALPHSPPGASLIGVDWGFCQGSSCTVSAFQSYPATGDTFTIDPVPAGSTVTIVVRVKADPASRAGAFKNTVVSGTVATSVTPQSTPDTTTNTASDETPTPIDGIEIDTVPNPPDLRLVTAGNAQAGVQWHAPSVDGGRPIMRYDVYANCPSDVPAPSCRVLANVSPTPNAKEGNSLTLFSYVVSPLVNGTPYRFLVTATNVVGESDRSNTLSTIPTESAVTEVLPAVGSVTLDNGFAAGAATCSAAQTTDPRCKNIVSNYTVTDTPDAGQLVNLNNEPINASTFAATLTSATIFPFECFTADLDPTHTTTFGTQVPGDCGDSNKVVRSTYPDATPLHLETDQYDTSITTAAEGAPCLALQLNSDKTVKFFPLPPATPKVPRCANPNFPITTATGTNLCPHNVGWTPQKPCAYIYYENAQTKPTTPTVLIGSSVEAGIKVNVNGTVRTVVPPWCVGKFPRFTSVPCVFKYKWLNNSTSKGNNDVQVQTYVAGDILKSGGTG